MRCMSLKHGPSQCTLTRSFADRSVNHGKYRRRKALFCGRMSFSRQLTLWDRCEEDEEIRHHHRESEKIEGRNQTVAVGDQATSKRPDRGADGLRAEQDSDTCASHFARCGVE